MQALNPARYHARHWRIRHPWKTSSILCSEASRLFLPEPQKLPRLPRAQLDELGLGQPRTDDIPIRVTFALSSHPCVWVTRPQGSTSAWGASVANCWLTKHSRSACWASAGGTDVVSAELPSTPSYTDPRACWKKTVRVRRTLQAGRTLAQALPNAAGAIGLELS